MVLEVLSKKNRRNMPPEEMIQTNLGRLPVLPKDIELHLVTYCVEMDKRFQGIRTSEIRRLAFRFDIRNSLKHTSSQKEKTAGYKWIGPFLKRDSELIFRGPPGLSTARLKGFTQENVNRYFLYYRPVVNLISTLAESTTQTKQLQRMCNPSIPK